MHQVFVSYSRTDAEWVTGLVRRLEASGVESWVDQRDIPVSLPWFEEVRDGIVEADLFLICRSDAWDSSEHCGSEAAIAFEAGKRACSVAVESDIATAAASVHEAIRALEPAYLMRTELGVLARDWDRALRRRDRLVSARHRRRLQQGQDVQPPLSQVERAFLRASKRRTRRRTVGSAVFVGVVTAALLAIILSNAARDRIEQVNDVQARAYLDAHSRAGRASADHYTGLSEAKTLGNRESAINAEAVMTALRDPVPDDAFRVPRGAVRFASGRVKGNVVVTDGRRASWARGAGNSTARTALPTAFRPVSPPKGAHGVTTRVVANTGIVDVFKNGTLWRRLVTARRVRAIALSPNGRELAIASGNSVLIGDVQAGRVRTSLRATGDAVRDVAWADSGRRLWALSAGRVVSWPVRDGVELADDPEVAFNSVFPTADQRYTWAAADDGQLIKVDLRDGRQRGRARLNDSIRSAAGSPDGATAAVSGNKGLWLVPLADGGRPRLVPVRDCQLGRPTFADARTIFVPCLSGPLVRVSVASGSVVARRSLSPGGIFAVRPLQVSGDLLATDVYGGIYSVTQSGLRELTKMTCGGYATRLALSPDERVLVPAGIGVGAGACALRGIRTGNDPAAQQSWRFDHVGELDSTPTVADVAAVSRGGGTFAYGFSDGTVVLHPTGEFMPSRAITSISGRVRDMYVTRSNDLVVATDAGVIRRIRLCENCLSNRVLAGVAAARLLRGVEIGTARNG